MADYLNEDARVFIKGRVSDAEDDKPSKLICEKIIPFDDRRKRNSGFSFRIKKTLSQKEQECF